MRKIPYSGFIVLVLMLCIGCQTTQQEPDQPNILFVISDDQSYSHTSFSGSAFIQTPAFDRVANQGVYFANCIAGSPGCAPSRSSIVTGRYPWQNEQSGQHASSWLKKYPSFVDELRLAGYSIGRTGKGVDPFRYAQSENDTLRRAENAAGKVHSNLKFDSDEISSLKGHTSKISKTDYVENFKYFIENQRNDKPFFFWFGAHEPHRAFQKGSWKKLGKKLEDVQVPGFLPDTEEVRGDLLDYAVEVEWFDRQLAKMMSYLERIGELDNTIIIVTSDNGAAFPRAKANAYEYGIHVPMAIRYPKEFPSGRIIEDPLSFVDLAPTILEIAQVIPKKMMPITGESFLEILRSTKQGFTKDSSAYVYSSRERHSSSRYKNLGYPQRIIRSKDFLYIWNMKPERWPAGAPQKFSAKDSTKLLPINGIGDDGKYISNGAYTDIDDGSTKTYMLENAQDPSIKPFLDLAVNKRSEFELYAINTDPYCLENLAGNPEFSEVEATLKKELIRKLTQTKDPRVVGPKKDIFEDYKRYSPIRKFPKPKPSIQSWSQLQ